MGFGSKLLKAIKVPAKRIEDKYDVVTHAGSRTRAGVSKVRKEVRRADLSIFGAAIGREIFSVANLGYHYQLGAGPSGGTQTEIVLESWCAEPALVNANAQVVPWPGRVKRGEKLAIRAATIASATLNIYPMWGEAT